MFDAPFRETLYRLIKDVPHPNLGKLDKRRTRRWHEQEVFKAGTLYVLTEEKTGTAVLRTLRPKDGYFGTGLGLKSELGHALWRSLEQCSMSSLGALQTYYGVHAVEALAVLLSKKQVGREALVEAFQMIEKARQDETLQEEIDKATRNENLD